MSWLTQFAKRFPSKSFRSGATITTTLNLYSHVIQAMQNDPAARLEGSVANLVAIGSGGINLT